MIELQSSAIPWTVAILGPGALGKAYGFALAKAGVRVVLVYRRARPTATETLRGVRLPLGGSPRACNVEVTHEIPACDVLLVTLRNEDLNTVQLRRLAEVAARPSAPLLVVLTPLLPQGIERLRAHLPQALLAVPTLAAELDDTQPLLRYWASALAPAPVEPPSIDNPTFAELVHHLRKAGLPLRPRADVALRGPATTIAFFPIQLALTKDERLATWPRHRSLMADVCAALRQCRALARRVGPVEPAVALLVTFASTRFGLWGLCQASRLAPRLSAFLGRHFGHKLLPQHQRFLAEIGALGRSTALPLDRLQALAESPASTSKS